MSRMSSLLRVIPFSLTLLSCLSAASISGAQTQANMTQVNPGQTVEIVAHGVCRRVHNGDSLAAMVPHASPAEWVTGSLTSFLSNVPENMVASSCVSPEIALRRWSRPGPPGSNIQPFLIDGSDYGLTFTSIGAAARGGSVSLNAPGNRISYTPPPEFWSLAYLEEEQDTVPFEAVDAEGITVSGTLRVDLVGFRSATQFRTVRYYAPESDLDVVGGRFQDFPSTTGPYNRFNSIFFFNEVLFEGQFSVHGVLAFYDPVAHVLLIDNSQAANATYSGGNVGNLNGDLWSNTILDAQLRAARDFVETRIAEVEAEQAWAEITDGASSAQLNRSPGAGSIIQPIWVYAINSGATYIGLIDGETASEVRSNANSVLAQVPRSSNPLRIRDALNAVETGFAPLIPEQFAFAFHLLSPGVNSGGAPTNLDRFNTSTAGNFGTPIFAFYTGSNPASPEAAFLAGLDRNGQARHMSNVGVFGGFEHPNAVTPLAVPIYWNGSAWSLMRDEGGAAFFQSAETYPGRRSQYRFSLRVLPDGDPSCTWGNNICSAQGVTTGTLANFDGFDPTDGVLNYFRMQFELVRNQIYRVHKDRYADFYNNSGTLILVDGSTAIEGKFTPLPPDP